MKNLKKAFYSIVFLLLGLEGQGQSSGAYTWNGSTRFRL
jgi:hypothetical protein